MSELYKFISILSQILSFRDLLMNLLYVVSSHCFGLFMFVLFFLF